LKEDKKFVNLIKYVVGNMDNRIITMETQFYEEFARTNVQMNLNVFLFSLRADIGLKAVNLEYAFMVKKKAYCQGKIQTGYTVF
jgi:hypothetical protein